MTKKNSNTRLIEHHFADLIVDQSQIPTQEFLQAITPAGSLSPLDAFMVYRGDYEARLTEALKNKYEGVYLIAGDDLFNTLAAIFLTDEKSSVKDLGEFGNAFPDWLTHSAPLHPDMKFLNQVAIVDLIFHQLFHCPSPTITRIDNNDASKIFLHNGKHIIQYDFTFPALSLWHHRYDEELPVDFNWSLKESIIFSKNVHNQIDTFLLSTHSLKEFWNYFSKDHSLLESLEYSSNQPTFQSSEFIPPYTDLMAWLSRHQLLRSI